MLQHGRTLKTLLNERSQTQKATYRMIPFTHETSRIDKSIETECKLVIARGWGRGKESGLSLNIVIPFYVCVFYFLSFSFKFNLLWSCILQPKKDNAKECSNYRTIALISHASKVMLKILQARLQQYVNHELPDVQVGFRKGRGTRDQIASIHWIIEKAR